MNLHLPHRPHVDADLVELLVLIGGVLILGLLVVGIAWIASTPIHP
ncbi:hypothetical protein [Nocardia spumae]|nr:hypothetical protein [Nocardia spumae]